MGEAYRVRKTTDIEEHGICEEEDDLKSESHRTSSSHNSGGRRPQTATAAAAIEDVTLPEWFAELPEELEVGHLLLPESLFYFDNCRST